MGQRLGALILILVLLGSGVLLGSALSQWWGAAPEGEGEAPSLLPRVQGRVRVEVLNAGGVPGVARLATQRLRDQGFDVVYYGNAGGFGADSSVVLDRTGALEAARAAAGALGIRRVRSEPDSNLYVDLTVRLGPEWVPEGPAEPPPASPRSWWDPRRLLPERESLPADRRTES